MSQNLKCQRQIYESRNQLTEMNQRIIPMLLLSATLTAGAQNDVDSAAVELHEVVIKAPRVVRKADMDLYYPSASAVANSKNGTQLIKNLMIPSLVVVESLGTIQAAGQTVQVRINGRESTLEQVQTLNPESIKRIEWIDNPGLRYGGATYVLNVIVVNPELGGSVMVEGMAGLNQPFSNNYADAKLNFGRSQFEFDLRYKLCNKI